MKRALTRKLVLEEWIGSPDGAGGLTGDWQALGTHWGEVRLRSGRLERGEASARSRTTYMVWIRAVGPDQASRPRAGQRFRDGDRVLLIRSVADARSGAPLLEILTDEEMLP